mmetsp:Transcript_44772/g.112282  ORF Transcript_44772/g.112282 Transcript_44772/m.112282 type:complete len:262 (+) Transcript_44772:1546-2331(+)
MWHRHARTYPCPAHYLKVSMIPPRIPLFSLSWPGTELSPASPFCICSFSAFLCLASSFLFFFAENLLESRLPGSVSIGLLFFVVGALPEALTLSSCCASRIALPLPLTGPLVWLSSPAISLARVSYSFDLGSLSFSLYCSSWKLTTVRYMLPTVTTMVSTKTTVAMRVSTRLSPAVICSKSPGVVGTFGVTPSTYPLAASTATAAFSPPLPATACSRVIWASASRVEWSRVECMSEASLMLIAEAQAARLRSWVDRTVRAS